MMISQKSLKLSPVVKIASWMRIIWIFMGQNCIAFVVSHLNCIYFYIPWPLILISSLLLNSSNLRNMWIIRFLFDTSNSWGWGNWKLQINHTKIPFPLSFHHNWDRWESSTFIFIQTQPRWQFFFLTNNQDGNFFKFFRFDSIFIKYIIKIGLEESEPHDLIISMSNHPPVI